MIFGQDEQETKAKNWTLINSASKLTNPLEMVKKTFQAFELLNFDVRLGQDELETDAKKRSSRNLAYELTNPLEMVKKTCQSLESLNSDFRARI